MFLLVSSSGPNSDTVQKEIEKSVMGNEIREIKLTKKKWKTVKKNPRMKKIWFFKIVDWDG